MENILEQIKRDCEALVKEHEAEANNEHLWAMGSSYPHIVEMHEENAEEHRKLAEIYRRMMKHPLTLVKLFEED